ncbi:MAG: preprotein translocase subunit SecG [Candidatus Eisenbacteria bacterium]|nr:preprotein translocase subunit SecG [Candidatus Eisenbacteria bacterium]
MVGLLLTLHILISAALVVVVLLQSGKGGGLAGAFGGSGGMGAVFGGQTAASLLTKATRYLAVAFMVSSLTLAVVSRGSTMGTVEGGLERRTGTAASATGGAVPVEGLPSGEPMTDETPVPAVPDGGGEAPVETEGGE